jgi:hypothetical protein
LPIIAAVGSLSKIVITGNVYIAVFKYDADNTLIATLMAGIFFIKRVVTIIAITPKVSK